MLRLLPCIKREKQCFISVFSKPQMHFLILVIDCFVFNFIFIDCADCYGVLTLMQQLAGLNSIQLFTNAINSIQIMTVNTLLQSLKLMGEEGEASFILYLQLLKLSFRLLHFQVSFFKVSTMGWVHTLTQPAISF